MKTVIASLLALGLLGVSAANADVVGVRVGHGHMAVVTNDRHHDYRHEYRHHVRRCSAWAWRHHHREHYCRSWY